MPSTDVWGFRPEKDTEADMKAWRDERELNDTETLRRLTRRGLEADEAEQRAREAVEEMQEVRRQWERERRRIVLLAGIALTGLALTFTTPAAGIAVAVAAVVGVALIAGGVVDWIAGRREGTEGLTEPPGPARDDG
jgi:predicted phage tail protein